MDIFKNYTPAWLLRCDGSAHPVYLDKGCIFDYVAHSSALFVNLGRIESFDRGRDSMGQLVIFDF
jgi:hypothetical protein